MEATATPTTYEAGVERAIASFTLPELQRFTRSLVEVPGRSGTVTALVAAMEEEGFIDSGWVQDYNPDWRPYEPAESGLVAAVTLATDSDDAAFVLYHRIIGVEVD